MILKLKSTIVIKNVNEEVVFALDLADTQDRYYKMEGVSSIFIKMINSQKDEEMIITEVMQSYEDCNREQIKRDLSLFVTKLQGLNFLV